jgi:hypothetical protein
MFEWIIYDVANLGSVNQGFGMVSTIFNQFINAIFATIKFITGG